MIEYAALKRYALLKYLAGEHSPTKIATMAGLDGDAAAYLKHFFNTEEFTTELRKAKKDTAAAVVDSIKEQLHKFLDQYIELAEKCTDPRVRATVLKDLLEKGGAGATAKFSLTSPDAYRKKVEEYLEDNQKSVDPQPAAEPDGNSKG